MSFCSFNNTNQVGWTSQHLFFSCEVINNTNQVFHNRCSFLVKSTFNNTNIIKPSWVDFTTQNKMGHFTTKEQMSFFVHHLQQHKPSWVDFTTKEQMSFCSSPSTTQTKWGGLHNKRMFFSCEVHLQQHKPSWVDFTTKEHVMFFSCEVHLQHSSNQVGWTSQQKNRCHFVHHLQQHKPSWVDFTTKEQMSFCSSPSTTQTKLGGLHNKRTDVILFITFNNTNQVGWTSQQKNRCHFVHHLQQHKPSWVDFTTKEQMSFCSSPSTTSNQVGWTSQQKNRCHFVHHLQQHKP